MVKSHIEAETVSTRRSGSEPHRHEGLSILHLARGRTKWSVDRQVFNLLEGQALIVLPDCVFGGIESSEGVPIRVERLHLHLNERREPLSASLSRVLGTPGEVASVVAEKLNAVGPGIVKLSSSQRALFTEIVDRLKSGSALEIIHANVCFINLLTGICLLLQGRGEKEESSSSDAERRVVNFLQHLEQRCDEPWMLDQMAEEAGLKRSRFGLLCRSLTGESPGIYLNRLRIRKSRRLLEDTDWTITDIAFDCGFSSSQYFAKIFRQFQGHEPTHYRRVSREQREGRGIQYLKGDTARVVAYAEREVGSGDFVVDCVLTLDRLGGTAASLEFGPDRFGFDGREGRLFLEGETFGNIRHFQRSGRVIREGIPFRLKLEREHSTLRAVIDQRNIFEIRDSAERSVGKVGLRPLRNGIRVESFSIGGLPTVLK